jgi:hypothetical protein
VRTLLKHLIIVRSEHGVCLSSSYDRAKMTPEERTALVRICRSAAMGWKLRKRKDGRDKWVQIG